ncbi:MAG TPA: FixH family protein [Thermodesulfovibrionales bacterium]|nr:FixH family protein [Thermodesulfovibrionales bacterium]
MKTVIAIVVLVGLLSVVGAIIVGTRTFEGIVTEKPYEKGLSWDRTEKERASSGLRIEILTKTFVTGDNDILFSVLDREDRPFDGEAVSITISRPSSATYDRTFNTVMAGEGVYRASVSFPLHGFWDLKIPVPVKGKEIVFEKRIYVEKGGSSR